MNVAESMNKEHNNLLPNLIVHKIKANNANNMIHKLSEIISRKSGINNQLLLKKLLSAEKNCQCGVGDGIAFPHIKLHNIDKAFTTFARLEKPVYINSTDNMPIDIVYMLISPEKDGSIHLRKIASISRQLKNKTYVDTLRNADCVDALTAILTGHDPIKEATSTYFLNQQQINQGYAA